MFPLHNPNYTFSHIHCIEPVSTEPVCIEKDQDLHPNNLFTGKFFITHLRVDRLSHRTMWTYHDHPTSPNCIMQFGQTIIKSKKTLYFFFENFGTLKDLAHFYIQHTHTYKLIQKTHHSNALKFKMGVQILKKSSISTFRKRYFFIHF